MNDEEAVASLSIDNSVNATGMEIGLSDSPNIDNSDSDMEISDSPGSESDEMCDQGKKVRSRKRNVCRKNWKMEVRKRKRQSGKEYEDRKGKVHRARRIQGDCKGACKFKCDTQVSADERKQIHDKFWSLSDTGKSHFYSKFVERHTKQRSRTLHENNRKFSYFYYLGTEKDMRVRVCKEFFFKTLDISQRRIYYFFQNVYDSQTGTARSPLKGKNTKSHIDDELKEKVRDHINSFPRIEAHYCRKDSTKEYLEGDLSLAEMYRLYSASVENPVKESLYRHIFNHEFNLEFFKPKKDRCDTCEAFKCNLEPSQAETERFNLHKTEKDAVKLVRDKDRAVSIKAVNDSNTCFIAFDLENVFALPKAEVSNFFYKRKLNCYNLTAHVTYKGQIELYCMVWHELISGRAGNHLASAVFKILNHVFAQNREIKKFVLWSDACVPQNKNSIMSMALKSFLKENPTVIEIVQRFSEPGHGVVQEVDAIHSKIERWLKPLEIFSPLSLVRVLVNKANKSSTKTNIIQMKPSDFFDFQSASKSLNYSIIPYTKIKEITVTNTELFDVTYKTSFLNEELVKCNIAKDGLRGRDNISKSPRQLNKKTTTSPQAQAKTRPSLPSVNPITSKPILQVEKKKSLQSMLKFMPAVDKAFYEALFRNTTNS